LHGTNLFVILNIANLYFICFMINLEEVLNCLTSRVVCDMIFSFMLIYKSFFPLFINPYFPFKKTLVLKGKIQW
jgi:hypothetical protein